MNLPAHLQQYQAPDINAALGQNLGSAMPPHVSIEGGRFTLVDASNNEIPVPTFDPKIGVYLDGALIDVNEHMSRMYYIKDYDPSAAGAPPDCWSDNGVAASIGATSVPLLQPPHPRAGQPAATCAECSMAVWGSKISNLGSKIPACSQKQKVALLVPGFPTLFLLAVPPNSHKFLREYVEKCRGSGINMADVITRISFVPGVQGTLQFSGVNYIDEPTAKLRQAAYAEKKTDALVGRNDVPRQGTAQIVQQNTPGMTHGQAAQLEHQLQAPAQQAQQPTPFVPSAATALFPTQQSSGQPLVQSANNPEPAPATRRRRRTAAEMTAANEVAGANQLPQQPAAAPQAPFPHPGQQTQPQGTQAFITNAPSQQAPQGSFGIAAGTPAAADPAVSTMLDNFFGKS